MQNQSHIFFQNKLRKHSIHSESLDQLEERTNDESSIIIADSRSSSEKSKTQKFAHIESQIFQWFQKRNIVCGHPQQLIDEFQEKNKKNILSQGGQQMMACLKKIPSLLQRRKKSLFSEGN